MGTKLMGTGVTLSIVCGLLALFATGCRRSRYEAAKSGFPDSTTPQQEALVSVSRTPQQECLIFVANSRDRPMSSLLAQLASQHFVSPKTSFYGFLDTYAKRTHAGST